MIPSFYKIDGMVSARTVDIKLFRRQVACLRLLGQGKNKISVLEFPMRNL
ncbi:MAG: hypothetical protein ACR5K4_03590 [Sodalis sp. (in: enterobacteria)]